jgi:hypothetical protein
MSLLYFHLRDGADHLLDPDGIELPYLEAAKKRAVESARGSWLATSEAENSSSIIVSRLRMKLGTLSTSPTSTIWSRS